MSDPDRPTTEGNPFSDLAQNFARGAARALDEEIMRLDQDEAAGVLDDPLLKAGQRAKNANNALRVEEMQREPHHIIQVKGNTAISRTIGDLLQLLAGQPVGSVSEKLIEAAAGVSALQRENALLRMENEDLKLRLRAAGVQMP